MTIETTAQTIAERLGLHGQYPADWDEFIGQDRATRQLRIACKSSAMRQAPMGHVLLASEIPGIGKTTLGLLIAWELGVGIKMASGRIDVNQARILLAGMRDRDVLLIDELHRTFQGGKAKGEWLLHLLQDGVIVGPRGPEKQPRITVVGSTTEIVRIPETILSRFPLRPTLEPYDEHDAALICSSMAARTLPSGLPYPSAENIEAIVRAANHNPRTMGSILANLRDLATVDLAAVHDGTNYVLNEPFEWLGLSEDGLHEKDLEYLLALLDDFGGQAGEKAMSDRMRQDVTYIERTLLDRGLIARTSRGRVLTQDGIMRAFEYRQQKKAA